jgi:DNA-binding NarL/FixJ family response regulator
MEPKIRVAVVDEYPLFRDGVAYTLEGESDMVVVGRGVTARDAIRLAGETEPDVMVLDGSLLGTTPEVLNDLLLRHPAARILALAVMADEEQVTSALKQGVRGFLLKGTSERELVQTVRALSRGEYYVSPSVAAKLLLRGSPGETNAGKFSDLTRREEQILSILVEGHSNKEIGNKLALSEKTIKHHITSILQKLQVRNRVEAALLASGRTSPGVRAVAPIGSRVIQ